MEVAFAVILVFLALLAVFDIFVGVSNDAVNFLGPAIGSRVARFSTVLAVASVGMVIGATSSSGMMEIARSGVFNPDMFTFEEVMVVFFAVMVTDVLLLNAFNALGLPTSTTVSVIFELLGGAVTVAALKLWRRGDPLFDIGAFINSEKALAITSAILVSVVVAFTAGVAVQFVTRFIFTFRYERMYRLLGGLFGGMSITAIFYFLVMKGARGTSFMTPEAIAWLEDNMAAILLVMLVVLAAAFQILILLFRFDIFRLVILSGTFALAFAFAGNDLVNFVGVPLAAIDSYRVFSASGAVAGEFTMESLRQAVSTPTHYLLASGLVMALTLWFSRKARRVVRTSINLSSATRGEKEQFGSSRIGRLLVRGGLLVCLALRRTIPETVLGVLRRRFHPPPPDRNEAAIPFDHVRAAINLVVASVLIASATSLKLPLSTTYVTFMVAMGTSFADGAWDRETAVYRISGVLMVIGGWFVTAVSAFTVCVALTAVASLGGIAAMCVLMMIALYALIRSNFSSGRDDEADPGVARFSEQPDRDAIRTRLNESVSANLEATVCLFRDGLGAFLEENMSGLKAARTSAAMLSDEISRKRGEYYRMALEAGDDAANDDAKHFYYRAFTNMKEVGHVLRVSLRQAEDHLANSHSVYSGTLRENLEKTLDILNRTGIAMNDYVHGRAITEAELARIFSENLQVVTDVQFAFLNSLDEHRLSLVSSDLYLGFLQFVKEFIGRYVIVVRLLREFNGRSGNGI